MISYIKGTLDHVQDGFIIVEAMGVGYGIFVSATTLSALPPLQSQVKVYTYLNAKEDGVSLYGFKNYEELELFNKLILVSGIGPKGAMNIIGNISSGELIMAIISEDIKTLSKLPGVGKKTAQRLILDLKDKFKNSDFIQSIEDDLANPSNFSIGSEKSEAIEAMLALGYSRSEALKAVSAIYKEGMDAGAVLKAALKEIVR